MGMVNMSTLQQENKLITEEDKTYTYMLKIANDIDLLANVIKHQLNLKMIPSKCFSSGRLFVTVLEELKRKREGLI